MSLNSHVVTSLAALCVAACAHAQPSTGSAAPAVSSQDLSVSADGTKISRTASEAAATASPSRRDIVPLIDAHQHMMGPAAMSTLRREPTPPAVAVPPVLAAVLSAREKGVDEATYDGLFTPDAQLFAEDQGRWWRGKARILDALGNFGSDHRFVPTSYALDNKAGYVSGVLRSASGQETHEFTIGIKKGADGRLRIASEMKQPIMPPLYAPSITAEKIIEVLDDAGIRYATVLSTAYWFGDPTKAITEPDRRAGTRAENDWVIAQSRKYPDRLIPICGVNPVAAYAIEEMERCAALGIRGMKIHRNSRFDPARPADLDGLKHFFRSANKLGMAIVVHLRGDTRMYIDHIFPEAPDIPIQIAHMGSGWDNTRLLADAIQAGKPGTKNLWLDWTQALPIEGLWGYGPSANLSGTVSPQEKADVVGIMRQIGLHRILFGTDMPLAWNPTPREWWRKTILTLPLTDDEVRDIADNLPPYMR